MDEKQSSYFIYFLVLFVQYGVRSGSDSVYPQH